MRYEDAHVPHKQQPGKQTQPLDCSECDVLKRHQLKIEFLVACADKEEGEDAQEQEQEPEADAAEEGSGDKAKPGDECICLLPCMQWNSHVVNELIDTEIKNLQQYSHYYRRRRKTKAVQKSLKITNH